MAGKSSGDALAAGLIGLGLGLLVGAALTGGRPERRAASFARIRDRLQSAGLRLLAAEVARSADAAVWVLTLELPDQRVRTLQAPLRSGEDPDAAPVCDSVADRVIDYVFRSENS